MSEERLQKILARAGVASRRKVEELIREARVTINGRMAEIGDKADLERDAVKLDGKRIQPKAGGHHYLLLNKPRGVMSTLKDPEGRPTVLDLVPPGLQKALVPVGRLDFLTEGLLLLTDDGDFAQHVAHPRYGCVKTYEAKVRGVPEGDAIARLEAGIVLDGKRTSPCRITARPLPRRSAESSTSSWWYVELGEGRTRQIRDMFERIGHPVQKLRRIAIGAVEDTHLPVGSLRELTEKEVEQLRRSTRSDHPAPLAKRPGKGLAAKRLAPGKVSGKAPTAKRLAPGKAVGKPASKRLAPGATGKPAAKRLAPGTPRKGAGKGRPAAAKSRSSRPSSARSPRGPRGSHSSRGSHGSR